jgi:hypothetical protein
LKNNPASLVKTKYPAYTCRMNAALRHVVYVCLLLPLAPLHAQTLPEEVVAPGECPIDIPPGDEGLAIMAKYGCKGVDYMRVGSPTIVGALMNGPNETQRAPTAPLVGSGQGQPLIDNPDTTPSPTAPAYDYGDLRGNIMYRAGMADAMQGAAMNRAYMTNIDYLRGYADGQQRR